MRHETSQHDRKCSHRYVRLAAWFMSRIILIVAFFGIFMPIGFIIRLFGIDPLQRQLNSSANTYYRSSKERAGDHMDKYF